MKPLPAVLFATAAIALAGAGVAAQAPDASKVHVMTVRLPGGGVEEIRYTGDVAPRVVFAPVAMVAGEPTGAGLAPMGFDASPFAAMDRISAEMDREAAAMFAQAQAMQARMQTQALGGVDGFTGGGPLGGGDRGFSFASTLSGSGVCMQSVEITSQGDGRQPRVVRRSSGDCGAAGPAPGVRGAAATALPHVQAPASESGPRYYRTSWRPTARPSTSDATLHTVSDAAD